MYAYKFLIHVELSPLSSLFHSNRAGEGLGMGLIVEACNV